MPHEFENKIVVTREELVPEFYPSWEALKRQLSRYKDRPYGVKRALQGKGLGNHVLIDFDSLSLEIRTALGDPRKLKHPMERFYRIDPEVVSFFNTVSVGVKGLKDYKKEEYITNASVLQAAILFRAACRQERQIRKPDALKNLDSDVAYNVGTFNTILEKKYCTRHNLPEHPRRLKEKMLRFEEEGCRMLISGQYGNRNSTILTDTTSHLLECMFARDRRKPYKTEVAERYNAFIDGYVELYDTATGEQFNPKDFKKLSERTITSFLASWKSRIATYKIRTGDRQKYMSEFESWVSTGRVEYAGSLISIDDRQPAFEYEKGKRMWFYLGIDLGSEAYTCFVYGKTKEGIILEFYRQMVRNYVKWGFPLPAELECESSLNAGFRKTFLQAGRMFSNVRIEANNARGKRIEQYFRQLRYTLERKEEEFLGRPFARNEANQARPHTETVPYDQLVLKCLKMIETWNNMEHSSRKGKTRWEVFREYQHPDLKPINWHGILPYLGYETKAFCKAGNVKINGKLFLLGNSGEIALGEDLIDIMKIIEHKTIKIYYLDTEDGSVLKAFAYLDDRYACELIAKPKPKRATIEQTAEDREKMNLISHYNNTIRAYATERKNSLTEIMVIDNRPQTLNNGFQIDLLHTNTGIRDYESGAILEEGRKFEETWEEPEEWEEVEEVEILDEKAVEIKEHRNPVEILPEPEEPANDFNAVSMPFQRHLNVRERMHQIVERSHV